LLRGRTECDFVASVFSFVCSASKTMGRLTSQASAMSGML